MDPRAEMAKRSYDKEPPLSMPSTLYKSKARRHKENHHPTESSLTSLVVWYPLGSGARSEGGPWEQKRRQVCVQTRPRPADEGRRPAQPGLKQKGRGAAFTDRVFPLLSGSGCSISSSFVAFWERETTLEHLLVLKVSMLRCHHLPFTDKGVH